MKNKLVSGDIVTLPKNTFHPFFQSASVMKGGKRLIVTTATEMDDVDAFHTGTLYVNSLPIYQESIQGDVLLDITDMFTKVASTVEGPQLDPLDQLSSKEDLQFEVHQLKSKLRLVKCFWDERGITTDPANGLENNGLCRSLADRLTMILETPLESLHALSDDELSSFEVRNEEFTFAD